MISMIVPVFNEESSIEKTLNSLSAAMSEIGEYEIICVNDGSTDNSLQIIEKMKSNYIKVISHVENIGYGRSLLDGIVESKYDCIAIIDADGSYPIESIKELVEYYPRYDMIVGARKGKEYEKGLFKRPARMLFAFLVKYATGRKVPDVNSGLRIFKKNIVLKFRDHLCAGFSFTTTLTLLFLLNHYFVKYVPIEYKKRDGNSKVKHFTDTLRAGQIIVSTIARYNPIKLFLLMAFGNAVIGVFIGVLNILFFNMEVMSYISAICIASFIPIFSLGLVAERLKINLD